METTKSFQGYVNLNPVNAPGRIVALSAFELLGLNVVSNVTDILLLVV